MKKLLLLGLCLAAWPTLNFAQIGCGDGRYTEEVFSNFTLTSDITYGSNYNLQGNLQSLEMDIYEPTNDTEPLRPLILMQHGGSFVGGSKTQADIVELAQPLAKRGFVVASVEYRLGMAGLPFPGPDSADASASVWRAVADFKAAVRFFYKNARDNGNTYKIDTNNIFIGGVSAGAVSAVHYAYLDDINEMPVYIDTTGLGMGGGIEGSSGNPGYPSQAKAVVNLCGMLADTAWIKAGEEPIVSLHGTEDDVVPYGTDMITVSGFYPIFVVDGSSSVHIKANQVGIENCFHTWYGAAHTPQIGDAAYRDTTLNVVTNFLKPMICGGNSQCGYLVSKGDPLTMVGVSVFPNPSHGNFKVRVPESWTTAWTCEMFDVTGRSVAVWQDLAVQEMEISSAAFPAGVYQVHVTNGIEFGKTKAVIAR